MPAIQMKKGLWIAVRAAACCQSIVLINLAVQEGETHPVYSQHLLLEAFESLLNLSNTRCLHVPTYCAIKRMSKLPP